MANRKLEWDRSVNAVTSFSGIGARVRDRRKQLHLTQDALATKLGYKDRTTLSRIELGQVDIPQGRLNAFADALQTTPAYLMGINEDKTLRPRNLIPLYSSQDDGEEYVEWIDVGTSMYNQAMNLMQTVSGDAMFPMVQNNDTVIVRKQTEADDGDIVLVRIKASANLSYKLIRRWHQTLDVIALLADNPSYSPLFFKDKERVELIGKVIEIRRIVP